MKCDEDCLEEEVEEEFIEDDYKNSIIDLRLSIQTRIQLIKRYYKENENNAIEIISRISGMYQFSGTKLLEQYLITISLENDISSFLKIEAVKGLLSFSEYEEDIDEKNDDNELKIIKIESNNTIKDRNKKRYNNAYNSINIVCSTMDNDLSTPYKIDVIYMLMENEEYYINSCQYFLKIINDDKINCDYRYKAILSLENKKDKIPKINYYISNSLINYILNEKNLIMYRILSGQYLLIIKNEYNVESILLEFAENEDNEYNLRADAADVLLSLGRSDEMKIKGREIIMKLSGGNVKTIFENKQNVHVKEIEKSVLNILESLCYIPIMKNDDDEFINFDYVEEKIMNLNKDDEIIISLNRIKMDRNLYSSLSITLSIFLIKLWSYIHNNENEYKYEMENRLLQELGDMAGTCSSGFISRLVNTISGFGDLSIHISFEDQIISNFNGRLNAYVRDIKNDDSPFINNDKLYNEIKKLYLKKNIITNEKKNIIVEYFYDLVLEEMSLSSSEYKNRPAFLLFFRTYMSKIREEMFKEFIEYITETEFDLYFRKALSYYDGIRDMI